MHGLRIHMDRVIMKGKKCALVGMLLVLSLTPFACSQKPDPDEATSISGSIIGGYRVVPLQVTTGQEINLTVFRGDYLKIKLEDTNSSLLFSIPSLSITETVSANLDDAPYIKMKATGLFPFSLGPMSGNIRVIEYEQANYRAVNSREAAELIQNIKPLILDVRTPEEYKMGHLERSILIPLQALQSRLQEISEYKNQDILIYCATGNRSTVASKILIDQGFKRIYNLQGGIFDWGQNKYPIVR